MKPSGAEFNVSAHLGRRADARERLVSENAKSDEHGSEQQQRREGGSRLSDSGKAETVFHVGKVHCQGRFTFTSINSRANAKKPPNIDLLAYWE